MTYFKNSKECKIIKFQLHKLFVISFIKFVGEKFEKNIKEKEYI
jgi:hypothetical protein